jgi:hypothetical protein
MRKKLKLQIKKVESDQIDQIIWFKNNNKI